MSNLQFDKLKFIEHVIGESFGTNNNDALMQQTEIKELQKFFKIDYNELVVLSILIEGGIRQEELGINAFIEHFGGGLSSLNTINDALNSLIAKGYVISTTTNRLSKTLIKQTFQADEKVYEALLSNKAERLVFKPAGNFIELLKHVQEHVQRRNDGGFDAKTLKKLVEKELTNAKSCKEIDWINSFKELKLSEKIILLIAAINHHKNEEQIDLEYNIKQVEDNFSKQRALRDSIANKTSTLIKSDLLFKDFENTLLVLT